MPFPRPLNTALCATAWADRVSRLSSRRFSRMKGVAVVLGLVAAADRILAHAVDGCPDG